MNFCAALIAFTYAECMLMSIITFFPQTKFCTMKSSSKHDQFFDSHFTVKKKELNLRRE